MPKPAHSLEREISEKTEEIRRLREKIHTAPDQLKKHKEDILHTMPAPDDLDERQREKIYRNRLSSNELSHARKNQAVNIILFVLTVGAIFSISLWIYRMLSANSF